jgi:hypothetical protein
MPVTALTFLAALYCLCISRISLSAFKLLPLSARKRGGRVRSVYAVYSRTMRNP